MDDREQRAFSMIRLTLALLHYDSDGKEVSPGYLFDWQTYRTLEGEIAILRENPANHDDPSYLAAEAFRLEFENIANRQLAVMASRRARA